MTVNGEFFHHAGKKKMMENAHCFFFFPGTKYICSDCFLQFYQEMGSCKDVHKYKPQQDNLLQNFLL